MSSWSPPFLLSSETPARLLDIKRGDADKTDPLPSPPRASSMGAIEDVRLISADDGEAVVFILAAAASSALRSNGRLGTVDTDRLRFADVGGVSSALLPVAAAAARPLLPVGMRLSCCPSVAEVDRARAAEVAASDDDGVLPKGGSVTPVDAM